MRFEEREGGYVVMCGKCRRPFARLTPEGVKLDSKHEHQTHSNTLSPDDLRKLAEITEAMKAIRVRL